MSEIRRRGHGCREADHGVLNACPPCGPILTLPPVGNVSTLMGANHFFFGFFSSGAAPHRVLPRPAPPREAPHQLAPPREALPRPALPRFVPHRLAPREALPRSWIRSRPLPALQTVFPGSAPLRRTGLRVARLRSWIRSRRVLVLDRGVLDWFLFAGSSSTGPPRPVPGPVSRRSEQCSCRWHRSRSRGTDCRSRHSLPGLRSCPRRFRHRGSTPPLQAGITALTPSVCSALDWSTSPRRNSGTFAFATHLLWIAPVPAAAAAAGGSAPWGCGTRRHRRSRRSPVGRPAWLGIGTTRQSFSLRRGAGSQLATHSAGLPHSSKPSSQMQAHVAASKTSPVPCAPRPGRPHSRMSQSPRRRCRRTSLVSKTFAGARALGQAGPTLAGLEALVADAGAGRWRAPSPVPVHSARQAPLSQVSKPSLQMQVQRPSRGATRPRRCPCTRPGRPHSRRSRSPRRRCSANHSAASKTSPVPVQAVRQAPLSQVSLPSLQMGAHVAASKTSPVPVHSARQAPLSQVSEPPSQMQAHISVVSKTSPGARALGEAGPTLAGLEALVADGGARRGVEDLAGARALGQAGPHLAGLEALVADAGAGRGVEDLAGARALGEAGPFLQASRSPRRRRRCMSSWCRRPRSVPVHSARQAKSRRFSKPLVADAGARSAASKTSPVPVHSARQAPLSQVSKPSSQMQAHAPRLCSHRARALGEAGPKLSQVSHISSKMQAHVSRASKTSAGARAMGLGRPHSRRSRSPRQGRRRTSRASKTSPVPVHSARQVPL